MNDYDKYRPGMVVKVAVKDFVTYKEVEFNPGPSLNMIIGPNGSGKSTLIAALILGLGGNPKTVGRGHKISEYVKHNCDNASIDIYIKTNNNSGVCKLTRHFGQDDKSVWQIDGKKHSQNDFLQYVSTFNIQIDNLCQFLPQDRVADFAKLNKQQLLKQTLKGLCHDDLNVALEDLATKRKRHKELSRVLHEKKVKLQNMENANLTVERKIAVFKKRQDLEDTLAHIERKIVWMTYLHKKEERSAMKEQTKHAQVKLNTLKAEVQPIEDAISKSKRKIVENKQLHTKYASDLKKYEMKQVEESEKINTLKSDVDNLARERLAKISEIDERKKQIENEETRITQVENDKRDLMNKIGGGEQITAHYQRVNNNIKNLAVSVNNIESSKSDINESMRQKNYEIGNCTNRLEKLNNVKAERLEILRRLNADAYTATMWLNENKQLFKGTVYAPMLLEINLADVNHAKYVESSISFNDLIAFTFTDKDDMNEMLRRVREQKRLKINAVHSSADIRLNQFVPNTPIEQLRQYGFNVYVTTLFKAPEPIKTYLCKHYNLHNIPVAFENRSNDKEAPSHIRQYYRGDFKFSVSISKYTRETSTRQTQVRSNNTLSIIIDQAQMKELDNRKTQLQKEIEDLRSELNKLVDRERTTNAQLEKERESLQVLRNSRKRVDELDTQLRILQERIRHLRQVATTPDEINALYRNKFKSIRKELAQRYQYIEALNEKSLKLVADIKILMQEAQVRREKIVELENDSINARRSVEVTETKLNELKAQFDDITNESKRLLRSGKELSGGFTPDDKGFDEYREAYDKLSEDVEDLRSNKDKVIERISRLHNAANSHELNEYNARVKEIKKIEAVISSDTNEFEDIDNNLDRLKQEWIESVTNIINEIHTRFSAGFERMNCKGRVALYLGPHELDFENYGLEISVTYRQNQPLQELNASTQSGGERAVATAIFMLSLQELTPVPFRCVDEINQGMDAENEERIFNLIVSLTTRENTAQYFLVTPKLIKGLQFVHNMDINAICCGNLTANEF